MARPALIDLPSEILEAIFLDLDPRSLLAVAQTSKFVKQLSADAPLIWRHLCHTHFHTWAPRHNIAAKFAGPLSNVDWRALFIEKTRVDRQTRVLLGQIIGSQHQRIRRINDIARFGYDAKETLLRECACPDDAEDVLARRYYANAVLERIHREIAINVWGDLRDGRNVSIDSALGAYDIFARVGEDVDIDVISHDLDHLVSGLLHDYPAFPGMNTRIKASTLAEYLRGQGFKGVPDTSYRALCNSFIGLVLRSPTHESLPPISVAIYCALARRVGLDARPCGFLFHVYCIVYAPKNHNLNGAYKPTSSSDLDFMYVDPFRSSSEVHQGDLQRVLHDMGVPSSKHANFLSDTNTRELVLRTARNIMNSVQTIRQTEAGAYGMGATWLNAYPDMDNSFYATIWSMLILGPGEDSTAAANEYTRRRQYLPYLLEHFQTHAPWDVALLEQYVMPMFSHMPEYQRLQQFVNSMRHIDALRKPVVPRRGPHVQNIGFKVGQLFQHKRYNYEGVITGWDISCDAGEEWIQNSGVDRLHRGRDQAFYHVLVWDKSIRYVAEENIRPVPPSTGPSPAMIKLAGRHFKRWDETKHIFVSNVRDEYPDD